MDLKRIGNLPGLMALGCAMVGWLATAQGAPTPFASTEQAAPWQWEIRYQGRPILVYSADPKKTKPYVKALYTLRGENVLRDSPSDHLHHHGLMYGINVNRLNFWEELAGAGVEKVLQTEGPQFGANSAGLPQATLRQRIKWVAPEEAFLPGTNSPALLEEERAIILTVNEARQEVALRWQSQFTVGTRTNTVALTGANYHGLGMRFPEEVDKSAKHFYAEGKPNLEGSKQDVSVHSWEGLSFEIEGKPATIVMFGDRGNVRGAAHFFSMRTPFAYLSATQALEGEPLLYHSGDKFDLNYLVALYSREPEVGELADRSKTWEAAHQ